MIAQHPEYGITKYGVFLYETPTPYNENIVRYAKVTNKRPG
jgi:hypothetical protein